MKKASQAPNHLRRLRRSRAVCMASLIIFSMLIGWQAVVLAFGAYPDHILPMVKLLYGTQECLPMAYCWTMRIAAITAFGFVISLIGLLLENRRLQKHRHACALQNRLTDHGV